MTNPVSGWTLSPVSSPGLRFSRQPDPDSTHTFKEPHTRKNTPDWPNSWNAGRITGVWCQADVGSWSSCKGLGLLYWNSALLHIFFCDFFWNLEELGWWSSGNPILGDFWLDFKRIKPSFLAQGNISKLIEAQTWWRPLGILKYIPPWSGFSPSQGCSALGVKFLGFPIF